MILAIADNDEGDFNEFNRIENETRELMKKKYIGTDQIKSFDNLIKIASKIITENHLNSLKKQTFKIQYKKIAQDSLNFMQIICENALKNNNINYISIKFSEQAKEIKETLNSPYFKN